MTRTARAARAAMAASALSLSTAGLADALHAPGGVLIALACTALSWAVVCLTA